MTNRHALVHQIGNEIEMTLFEIFSKAEDVIAETDDLVGQPLEAPYRRVGGGE